VAARESSRWLGARYAKATTPAEKVAFARQWQRKLYDGGWAGISWPKGFGGQACPRSSSSCSARYFAAGAPDMIDIAIGLNLVGPTLIHHGTEAQKARFLDPILRGEEVWCQGFSEPDAGSDLAALRTRAEVTGDHLVVNGQKVWTSYARYAEWCILIVRTNPAAPKHRGLTFALLDMKTPGITIRPLVEMTGVAWFNEVFFEDVVIPRDMVVGDRPRLGHRDHHAVARARHRRAVPALQHQLDASPRWRAGFPRTGGRPPIPRPPAPGALAIDVAVLRLSTYRNITELMRSGRPGPEARC
jgi:alkylation response protein AidB-like acyl-CoA dehydrogenase